MRDDRLIYKAIVVLVWFRITLTTFRAKITIIYLCCQSYAWNTIGSIFPDTVYIWFKFNHGWIRKLANIYIHGIFHQICIILCKTWTRVLRQFISAGER